MAGALMARWFTQKFRQSRVAELRGYVNMLARTSVEGYIGACCALRDADLREPARSITQPALVICGDQDVATPPDVVQSFAGRIPAAQFSLINGAAHLPCIEQPERSRKG
jgi:3-oxoadipate enol-lactonase